MPMNDNIITTVKNELCFGCGSCVTVCPVQAVQMHFSPLGRLLPTVDVDRCTHCGLCLRICPGIDMSGDLSEAIDASLMGQAERPLFAKSTDQEVFANAQSGGAVTTTLAYLFDQGHIDAALVVGQEHQKAQYRVVTSKQELLNSQSSQYTPVDLNSALPNLVGYDSVAVVGLPCHIEGIVKLKKAFPDRFSNIHFLMGLVCAGALTQACVEVTRTIGEPKVGPITDDETIFWRLKKYSNYKRADIAIVSPNGNTRTLSNNIRLICKNFLTSPRCKLCFDKMNLYSDITFGDCWGIKGEDVKNGGNVIISRNETGQKIVTEMVARGLLDCRPCSIAEITQGQGIPNKKKTIEKTLAIYRKMKFELPGWAGKFAPSESIDGKLMKKIGNFIKNDSTPNPKVLKRIVSKVKCLLLYKTITAKIRKTIGIQ